MFNPSRQDARRFFFDTWAKHGRGTELSDLEKIALTLLLAHPEYHHIVDNPQDYLESDWTPEMGQSNPFLHLGLHLAIEEQRSIDQPFGIRSLYAQLALRHGDEHRAQHEIMECLAEMIWHAQRYGGGPDVNLYISAIRKRLGMGEEDERRLNPGEAG
ncbi:DUF1841 family protein [Crenobacter intestini]|uniref:DUF1841 family protein n=1 Tax=Crenobacter intestini TaxID=2563443 RepID=A0A4T0V0R8_9NEIS|nr:DUF1841 family protein [Crenobacter intestini]TIC84665.1 DUF1841 family protein [Crenobacter intestini]